MYGFLFVNGLIFLIVGLRALLKPDDAVAVPYGLTVEGIDARNYLRASAGGVTIVAGAVQILGVVMPEFAVPALVMVVTLLGGLVAGRLFSLIIDGNPGIVPWVAGFFESVGLGLGAYWLVFALN